MNKIFLPAIVTLIAASFSWATPLNAAESLIPNGDMEMDNNADGWPDHWPRPANSSAPQEDGNRFIRMEAKVPGKMVTIHQMIEIPAGSKALKLNLRIRTHDLKPGKQPWFDARVVMNFKDAEQQKIGKSPSAIYTRKSTDGWVEKEKIFEVPEGVRYLEFMPSLFQVERGVMDLDDVVLVEASAEELAAAKAATKKSTAPAEPVGEQVRKENWPPELKVVGNRLHDPEGNEVWLQGVHVPSLEWSAKGESVLASVKHAIDEWKANVIRLSIKPDFWAGQKGNDAAAYQALVDAAVTLAANRGAYLLIDSHTYRAPRPEDVPFWKEVAGKYANHPAVLFDIINEPHGISWDIWKNGGFVETRKTKADEDAFTAADDLKKSKEGFESPGMQKMVEVIRATGARNIIVAGGLDWAYDLSGILKGYALEDPSGNGIMYSSHIYPWKKGWQTKVLDVAEHHPIFVGELGANTKKMGWMPANQQEDAATWVPAILGLIQKHKLNWSAFSFHPKASPVLLLDWQYTPTPEWGVPVKQALSGKQFELDRLR